MVAFWKKADQTGKKAEKPLAKDAKPVSKKTKIKAEDRAHLINKTLIRPVVSEDAFTKQTVNKYVFEVSVNASKNEIAEAVEALYGVSVTKVNTIRKKPLFTSFKGVAGQLKGRKKAVVTVKEGQKIELFKEV